jgi:arylsulfatase A-like enzyme
MPFPRCKSNLYDLGIRVPLAVRFGRRVAGGRTSAAFVSLTDIAPTLYELAGVAAPPGMDGRSLVPLLDDAPGAAAAHGNAIFGKERHVPCRPDHSGYPCRGMRTADWAYIRNYEPERWPVGDPPIYGDTDPARSIGDGITKDWLIGHRDDDAVREAFRLCFGKRPAEELYDMRSDPDQLRNLAADPAHAAVRDLLRAWLDAELVRTGDPRVLGGAEQFDRYPYYGQSAWRADRK